jgi:hypothetical protein
MKLLDLFGKDSIRTHIFTTTEAGTVTSVSTYTITFAGDPDRYMRGVVALGSTLATVTYGSTQTVIGAGSFTSPGWASNTVTSASLTTTTAYRIGVWLGGAGEYGQNLYYDSGVTLYRDNIAYHATNAPPNPIVDDATADFKISMYATYALSSVVKDIISNNSIIAFPRS